MATKVVEQHLHPKYPRLRIQLRSNSKFYQAVTRMDGKLHQSSTKTTHLPTALKIAEDWYRRQARASVALGRQHPIAQLTSDPTMAELYRSYSAELPKNKQEYADQKWSPIADFWRALTLSTVGTQTFKDFYAWRRRNPKHPIKNHTLHKDVVLIRQVLKYALNSSLVETLPHIPPVGKIVANPRPWLTPQELSHLTGVAYERLANAPNERVEQQRQDLLHMMGFLESTMVRVGELRTLRFHSCRVETNNDGDKMLLCEVTGKRGTRTVVGNEAAVLVYEERLKYAKPEDLIFPHHCRDGFRELLKAAGLHEDRFGFTRNLKSLRATAISGTILESPTLNLAIIARNAGTSVAMIDNFYAARLTAEMAKHELSQLPEELSARRNKKKSKKRQ